MIRQLRTPSWRRSLWALALTAAVAVQGLVIYHRVFDTWEGPIGTLGKESLLPAVFIAAGRGFVAGDPDAVPGLRAFMNYETRQFDTASIPADAKLEYPNLVYQWHRYVLYTVGWVWRLFGVSWDALAILIMAMLFLSCLAVYGISRQAMSIPWSLLVTEAFAWNLALFSTMPLFRDFSKAPFILAVIYLLARAIRHRLSWKAYLGTAVLIGLVFGLGMGFRRDMAALAPLAALVLCLCRIKPVRYGVFLRPAAVLLLFATFVLVAFPILKSIYPMRWTNGHDLTMGLSSRCEQELGTLMPASYEKHYLLQDTYTAWMIWAAANEGVAGGGDTRQKSAEKRISQEQLIQDYLMKVIRLFPADFLSRTYAAILRCVVGLRSTEIPVVSLAEPLGMVFLIASLLILAVTDFWMAWQVVILISLFCGYTSLQFGLRHAFHLSFVPYWFGCFTVSRVIQLIRQKKKDPGSSHNISGYLHVAKRLCLWLIITIAVFWIPLKAARWVQYGHVADLRNSYTSSERLTLAHAVVSDWTGETLVVPVGNASCKPCFEVAPFPHHRQRVLVARFKETTCPVDLKIVYEWNKGGLNFSGPVWSYTRPKTRTGIVDVFFSVFESNTCGDWNRFAGLLMSEEQAGSFQGFQEVRNINTLGFFMNLTVPENRNAFEYCQEVRIPWPWQPPLQYPWPMEDYLNQDDNEIVQGLMGGDYARSAEFAESALRSRPGSVWLRMLWAQSLFLAGRVEEAWRVVDEMLNEYSGEDSVYQGLDMVFDAVGGAEGRQDFWKRIVEVHPGDGCAKAHLERLQHDNTET